MLNQSHLAVDLAELGSAKYQGVKRDWQNNMDQIGCDTNLKANIAKQDATYPNRRELRYVGKEQGNGMLAAMMASCVHKFGGQNIAGLLHVACSIEPEAICQFSCGIVFLNLLPELIGNI